MSNAERMGVVRERDSVVSLSDTLSLLRRRWLLLALSVFVCVGLAIFNHERAPKLYQASASVSFQNGTLSDAALAVQPGGSSEPQREANTETLVAHSSGVAEAVRKELGLRVSASELLEEVKVEPAANANVLNMVATTSEPHQSAQIANSFAQQYINFRTKSQLAGIAAAQRQLQEEIEALPAGSSERADLQQSVQRLGELRAVAGGGATVIGLATPPSAPTGLTLSTTIAMGVLIGLAIGLALVFLLEALDRKIRTVEEFERIYRLPTLSIVPQTSFGHRRADQRESTLEPYRILRSALDFAGVTRKIDSLLVTSAVSGEGKTTVAIDLAHVIALTGRPVTLIELDLRRPTFSEHFNLDIRDGLTTGLVEGRPVQELLANPFPDLPNLAILPGGRLPHNPAELLGSPQIVEIISGLARTEGMVIIDAPPLLPVADAQVLLNSSAISAAILVARVDRTKRDEARRVRAILDQNEVEAVGLVITGLRDSRRYGYEQYSGIGPALDTNIDMLSRPRSLSARRRASS